MMKKIWVCVIAATVAASTFAGGAGVVIKGVAKSWDDIARMALKASGKEATDDAVKAATKTIKAAAEKYGDDVAEASARGGVEVAEQATKKGSRFVSLLGKTGSYSDDALRAFARNADDVMKYSAKYGNDVVKIGGKAPGLGVRTASLMEKNGIRNVDKAVHAVAELPAEDIPRVLGAVEKNPSVAGVFIEHVEKGGKYFVDKVFALNGTQIMAGGLTTAMIVAAFGVSESVKNLTHPMKEQGEAIRTQHEKAMQIIDEMDAEGRKQFADNEAERTHDFMDEWAQTVKVSAIVLVSCIGLSLLVLVVRKTRSVKPAEHKKDRRIKRTPDGCCEEEYAKTVSMDSKGELVQK